MTLGLVSLQWQDPPLRLPNCKSGIGNVVFQVAAQTGCSCYGIEIREDLHNFALSMEQNFCQQMTELGHPFGETHFIHVCEFSILLNPHY